MAALDFWFRLEPCACVRVCVRVRACLYVSTAVHHRACGAHSPPGRTNPCAHGTCGHWRETSKYRHQAPASFAAHMHARFLGPCHARLCKSVTPLNLCEPHPTLLYSSRQPKPLSQPDICTCTDMCKHVCVCVCMSVPICRAHRSQLRQVLRTVGHRTWKCTRAPWPGCHPHRTSQHPSDKATQPSAVLKGTRGAVLSAAVRAERDSTPRSCRVNHGVCHREERL